MKRTARTKGKTIETLVTLSPSVLSCSKPTSVSSSSSSFSAVKRVPIGVYTFYFIWNWREEDNDIRISVERVRFNWCEFERLAALSYVTREFPATLRNSMRRPSNRDLFLFHWRHLYTHRVFWTFKCRDAEGKCLLRRFAPFLEKIAREGSKKL